MSAWYKKSMAGSLYLLDGYSVIYRSYFAFIRQPMRNPRGENSSAVFGFVRTLLSLFSEHDPKQFVVVMDSPGPTFRHERYPEYKANRESAPDDLHAQVPIIEEICRALGIQMIRADGFEADDIMATLADQCRARGHGCRVITGDKDLLQLVGETVRVLKPDRAGTVELDRDAVFRDWGVWPEQILDYLSLVGDSSDNVPGVKGIGAKTAVKLFEQFNDLDTLYASLEEVSSNSWRTKLEEGRESAFMSRDLIRLRFDAPIPEDFEGYRVDTLDYRAAAPLLVAQGMRTVVKELGLNPEDFEELGSQDRAVLSSDGARAPAVDDAGDGESKLLPTASPADRAAAILSAEEQRSFAAAGNYELVDAVEALDRWIAAALAAPRIAFDSETDSLDPRRASPIGFSLAIEPGKACYIALKGPDGVVLDEEIVRDRLRPLLESDTVTIVGQNLKYDMQVLSAWGVTISAPIFDTMIAAWLVDTGAGSYGMDRLAAEYLLYRTVHYADVVAKGSTFADVPLAEATRYAAEDADVTLRLAVVLERLLDLRGVREIFASLEMPLLPLLAEMEREGIGLDVGELERYSAELSEEIASVETAIFAEVGHEFNVASTKQLQEVLFTERKLQPIKKTKTGFSTDNSVLQELAREDTVPHLVLRYRLLSKLRSTYVDALPTMVNPDTGRLHTSFNQTGTATGRLSSTDPNLQNIPIKDEEGRRIRDAFIPRPGWVFVSADYAQIELVILAHLSGDAALREAFTTGEDVHRRTASLIFGVDAGEVSSEQRRIAKTINFGVMYGMSAFRLANELGIPRGEADSFIKAYFGTYRGIRRFIDETVAQAERDGEIRTLLGRPRPLTDINNRNRTVKAGAERIAVNTPIQGTGADIVKRAMLKVDKRLRRDGLAARMVLQVHDELILESPPEELDRVRALLMEEMSTAVELSIPLRVSVEHGTRWGAMHQ